MEVIFACKWVHVQNSNDISEWRPSLPYQHRCATLKGRTIHGMREHACVFNDYPSPQGARIACIAPLSDVGAGGHPGATWKDHAHTRAGPAP